MPSKFEWQAEDDALWHEPEGEKRPPRRPRRRWPSVLLIAALAMAAAGLVWRQVDQRIDENAKARRTDVVSSHNLVRLAEAEDDNELFYSLLSGRDSDWTDAQNELFRAGVLLNRGPFGLHKTDAGNGLNEVSEDELKVTFSTDLLSAEVVSEQAFTTEVGPGVSESVTLLQTAVYRQGQERWLLSPPEDDFWGSEGSLQDTQLRIIFPERDEEIAGRLLGDLASKTRELCQTLVDLDCPEEMRVDLQLSPDPATLASTTLPRPARTDGDKLVVTLPTPTLVGLPVDDASYRALYRGYASQLASALITHFVGYDCCDQAPFFQAVLDYQLDQLSLRPWPVTEEDYQRVLEERLRLADLSSLWHSDDPQDLSGEHGWRIYTAVDTLLRSNPDLSAIQLQREMVRRGSFFGWLNGVFAGQNGDAANAELHSVLMRQFWLEAYPQAMRASAGSQVPAPDQDLLFSCAIPPDVTPEQQTLILYRYDFAADSPSEILRSQNFWLSSALARDRALLLQEFDFEEDRWLTNIWQDSKLSPLMSSPDRYSISFGQTDPSGSQLLAFVFAPEAEDATITLFDLEQCAAAGCAGRELPGIPIWSPDGSQALYSDKPDLELDLLQFERRTVLFDFTERPGPRALYHAEASKFLEGAPLQTVAGLTPIGEGFAPFWIDNDTVGYIAGGERRRNLSDQGVYILNLQAGSPERVLAHEQLVEALPEGDTLPRLFWIHYVMANPADPQMLFVVGFSGADQQAHVFSFRRDTGEVQHLMDAGYEASHSLSVSPDGRFLVLTGVDSSDPDRRHSNVLLLVYDLDLGEITPFLTVADYYPPFATNDWSGDGSWLAMMLDRSLVGLYQPAENTLRLVELPVENCFAPAWINR